MYNVKNLRTKLQSKLKSFANQFESTDLQKAQQIIQIFNQECQQELLKLYPQESDESREQTFEELENLIISTIYQQLYPLVEDKQQDEKVQNILQSHQFLKPENLEIKEMHISQEKIKFIIAQIGKICIFKNPKDKLICIVNACKLVSGMVKHFGFQDKNQGPGADDFLPVLIYVVLKAQPQNPISNLNFIRQFFNEDKLSGDVEYYLTAYQSVFEFFTKISHEKLKIDKDFYNQSINQKTEQENTLEQDNDIQQLLFQNVCQENFQLKNFEDMSISDLQKLYKNYIKIKQNYEILSKIVKKNTNQIIVQKFITLCNQS